MRVFLDANIIFSAAKNDGAVRRLLYRLLERGHTCVADAFVVDEARRNLSVKGREALANLDALLLQLTITGASALDARLADALSWLEEKDRPVLAAAIRSSCEALVTGDRRHFGPVYGQVFGGVTIHSPRSLAEALLIAG